MSEGAQKDKNISELNKFLSNNEDFLQDKYMEYFKSPSLTTKEIDYQLAIKYIYDVFSFSKYEADEKMNLTLQKSLMKNMQDFVAQLERKKLGFNSKTAVQLLKFCIENNQMFAVKYDKKDKKIKTEEHAHEPPKETERENNEQILQGEPKMQQGEQDIDKSDKATNQEEVKKQQDQRLRKQEQPQHIHNNQQNQAIQKSQTFTPSENNSHINQFAQEKKESPQKQWDPELIKKNFKLLFEFYCKQQQNVGVNATFDRIGYECKTMTLGKFMAFAYSTQILNEKIDKSLLMRKYKLVAEGKKEIEFQQFYSAMMTLAGIDQTMIPKLGVDEKVYFKTKMKERSFAFNTKDQSSRDIKRDSIFIPKLTGHSGKLSDALHEQIKLRKSQKPNQQPKLATHNENIHVRNLGLTNRYDTYMKNQLKQGSHIISSPTQLVKSDIHDFQEDLGFLEKMINVEKADEHWLKEYQIPSLKHVAPMPPRLMSRKESIVPNLRKRVQELERTETRQTTHLEKRKFISSNIKRQKNSKSVLN